MRRNRYETAELNNNSRIIKQNIGSGNLNLWEKIQGIIEIPLLEQIDIQVRNAHSKEFRNAGEFSRVMEQLGFYQFSSIGRILQRDLRLRSARELDAQPKPIK